MYSDFANPNEIFSISNSTEQTECNTALRLHNPDVVRCAYNGPSDAIALSARLHYYKIWHVHFQLIAPVRGLRKI